MTDPTIAVLRADIHGLSSREYADALKERLPNHEIRYAATPQAEREYVADAEIVTGTGIDTDLLDAAGDIELFACAYAGYNHLPMDALRERGVAVTNGAGIHAPGIAEQVLGYVLTFARNLQQGVRQSERGEWRHYKAHGELTDATVTIVGLGAIGTAVEQRLRGFGAHTIGVRYTPEKGGPTDEIVGFDPADVHDAFARSDYVVLACPLTETTQGLVDAAAFETLAPESVLVNVARGGVVETDALVDALRRDAIRGAALDVTDPEPLPPNHVLWTLDNCLVTPHNAGHTPKHWTRLADILEENVKRLEAGEELENRVD
ncbi:D-2-hydroxyacid dehydrogenase [Salarchaeum sp. JOR-1]|uniref:D-2-hydroxyacid dehydrogenase n=1 Tax=Salarchaeum sp. JOR-1 TaxID=2599399 RepID=UPI0011986A9B|nr:D-2-hydroxyacid dehydrogenase [Salarchaeum sp. JOR-1]QDX41704.1 D-2-hydroxyacid dehydrogenase [Salarchaeum sp. JOR-1]